VEHFARSIGAHLIIFTVDIIEDLVEHFAKAKADGQPVDVSAVKTALDDIEPSEIDDARVFLANNEEESDNPVTEPREKVESPMPDISEVSIILKVMPIRGSPPDPLIFLQETLGIWLPSFFQHP
jgi:hypothetical protein